MTYKDYIYHCINCHNKVKVLESGQGTLYCCGKPMEQLKPGETEPDEEPVQ